MWAGIAGMTGVAATPADERGAASQPKPAGSTAELAKPEKAALPLARWTFDQDEVGKPPTGLVAKETHPGPKVGAWTVAVDAIAPTPPHVLKLTTEEPNATYNIAILEKTAYEDLDLRVWVKGDTGKEDQGGGLIWRCKDENNYYVCRINPLENNFRVYKVVEGKRQQLQSVEFKAETGKWHQVRAVMLGHQIACYVDGKQYLEAQDDTFKEAGMIGLWTKADASSSFDDLSVYPAPVRGEATSSRPATAGRPQNEVPDDNDGD